MTNIEIIGLMIKSSNHNPYIGILSVKQNLLAAIELAKLFKEYADAGDTDSAMDIKSEQWQEVVETMEDFRDRFFAIPEPNF